MIALIFSGSGLIPDLPTTWPKKVSDVLANWHLL